MQKQQPHPRSADAPQPPDAEAPTPPPIVPDEIAALLGKPPLIHGEERGDYQRLFNRIAAEVDPQRLLEWLWVKDLADNVWETLRLRRMLAGSLNIGMVRSARHLLLPLLNPAAGEAVAEAGRKAERIVIDHLGGVAAATAELNELLAHGGFDDDALAAISFETNFDLVERGDRMLATHERRRDQILRDIEWHRAVLAERLREVADALVKEGANPEANG